MRGIRSGAKIGDILPWSLEKTFDNMGIRDLKIGNQAP
jgi:hypothetical protein